MGDYVPDEERDEVIKRLIQIPENKVSLFLCVGKCLNTAKFRIFLEK